jgi:hypothetical protein
MSHAVYRAPMIQPNCRARFTAEDFNFVVRTLAKSPGNEVSLVQLLTDIETRDQILDHDDLVRAVLERPGNLTISPQFYFYILARLVLKRSGIDDRTLTDYVAALLEKFSHTDGLSARCCAHRKFPPGERNLLRSTETKKALDEPAESR